MKKFFSDLSRRFSSLTEKNVFLIVVSVVLAIIIWFSIIYYANPINSKQFSDLPVKIQYDGSTPSNNGLMMLVTDTNFTCDVTVEGGRSELLTLNADDITARLDLDSVAAAGVYEVPVNVSVINSDVTCTSLSPSKIRIEFVKVKSKTVSVDVNYENTLSEGYEITENSVTPDKITVSGPADIIDTVASCNISVDLATGKDDINNIYSASLFDADNNAVEMKYLTLSSSDIQVKLSVDYRRVLPLSVQIVNSNGGNERLYSNILCNPDSVIVQGDEDVLDALGDEIILGTLDVADTDKTKTATMVLPEIDGVKYISDTDAVTVTVSLKGVKTKTITLNNTQMNALFTIDDGYRITSNKISVKVRAKDIDSVSADSLIFKVDTDDKDSSDRCRVVISNKDGISVGIIGKYYVAVAKK